MQGWIDFQDSLVLSNDHVVMGRPLKPFCLEYQFWLEVINSPIITGNQISVIDLELAAMICQCDYKEAAKLAKLKFSWLDKIKFGLKVARLDLEIEMLKFRRYMDDSCSLPETLTSTGENRSLHQEFPSVLSTASLLMKNNFEGGDREQIFMTPLGEAHWYAISFVRHSGNKVDVISSHDREFMEGIRKMRGEQSETLESLDEGGEVVPDEGNREDSPNSGDSE